ncbi:hypothetical protein DICA3_C04896 [Diutina catenulata]
MSRYIHGLLPNFSVPASTAGQLKNLVIFEDEEIYYFHDVETSSTEAKMNLVGLISGMGSFTSNFQKPHAVDEDYMVITTDKNTIVCLMAGSTRVAATVIGGGDDDIANTTHKQIVSLMSSAWRMYLFLHGYPHERTRLASFFDSFFARYNSRVSAESAISPNSLNYRGLLGFLPGCKRSSIRGVSFSECLGGLEGCLGGTVAHFDPTVVKKYGTVTHAGPSHVLYNWLEFYHHYTQFAVDPAANSPSSLHNTGLQSDWATLFDVVPLVNVSSGGDEDDEINDGDSTTGSYSHYVQLMNPINLTNNLVVSPLNYTVSSLKGVPESLRGVPESTSKWWTSVNPLKAFSFGGNNETEVANEEEEGDENTESQGQFLIGLVNSEPVTITTKSVYVNQKEDEITTSTPEPGMKVKKVKVVVYLKKMVCIALLFEENDPRLSKADFYTMLSQTYLDPTVDEVIAAKTGSGLVNSVSTLPRGLNDDPDSLDSDFFYVVYNQSEKWYQTSLPYLPQIDAVPVTDNTSVGVTSSTGEDAPSESAVSAPVSASPRLGRAICHLHEQLAEVFISRKLLYCGAYEYFHKFTSSKMHDWSFYFIRQGPTVIIIAKNQNRTKSSKKQPMHANADPSIGLLDHLPNPLGFLDNLGDDVKSWLSHYSPASAADSST